MRHPYLPLDRVWKQSVEPCNGGTVIPALFSAMMLLDECRSDRVPRRVLLCGAVERSTEKQGADQRGGEKNREVQARNALHHHARTGE